MHHEGHKDSKQALNHSPICEIFCDIVSVKATNDKMAMRACQLHMFRNSQRKWLAHKIGTDLRSRDLKPPHDWWGLLWSGYLNVWTIWHNLIQFTDTRASAPALQLIAFNSRVQCGYLLSTHIEFSQIFKTLQIQIEFGALKLFRNSKSHNSE